MKKILAALAVAAFASSAHAVVSGSSHDFVTNSGFLTVAPAHACKGCHTAHAATMSNNLIWARSDYSSLVVTVYSARGTADARGVLACMSCHATDAASGLAQPLASAELTTNLGTTHPVGSGFTFVPGTTTGFQATLVLGGTTLTGTTVTMMCSTCHTVHNSNAATGRYLLKSYGSAASICVACHNK